MSLLHIQLKDDQTAYQPGDDIAGFAAWRLDDPADTIHLRLFWYTEGKGTQDVDVVDELVFEQPLPEEKRDFSFKAPRLPYSFSGKLLSFIWALELVMKPGADTTRQVIIISPSGREILAEQVDE